ncbi:energy transducer TonB [Flammeovirga pectinis]|uniref:Energy transducer TonB n=1 Tax=Flammeovirga pectinis TaxID=2494373 RepID=A0A3S9P7J2_9BACT|nr:energy transducer TonB [Flammeovirga pectinis]AZQ64168.1 energy transducer TonB [Flammeovirga pectinis]
MIDILKLIGPEGILFFFVTLLIVLVQLFRYIIKKREATPTHLRNDLQKKYDSVNLDKYTSFFRMVGLSIAMVTLLAAFEYPTPRSVILDDWEAQNLIDETLFDSSFVIPEPVLPKVKPIPKVITIIEVDDPKDVTDIIIDIPEDFTSETEIEDPVENFNEPDEEVITEFVTIAEQNASFKGGMGKFYKWLGRRIKYPAQAKRMGVEGKVFVQFIIELDGKLSNVKVVRGIGGGCDEEAVRVLKSSPDWKPAQQRGRAVRMQMVIPISFQLN